MVVQTVGHMVLIKVMWKTMLFWGCGAIKVSTEFWWKEITFWSEDQEKITVQLKMKNVNHKGCRLCSVRLVCFYQKLSRLGKMNIDWQVNWSGKRFLSRVSLHISKKACWGLFGSFAIWNVDKRINIA